MLHWVFEFDVVDYSFQGILGARDAQKEKMTLLYS